MKCQNICRKIRSLEYAVLHLKLEIEEVNDEMNEYTSSFMQSLHKVADFSTAPETKTTIHSKNEFFQLSDKPTQPEELKKLWKKIAAVTHPDKTGNNQRLTSLYRRAAEAIKASSAHELVQIAIELKLKSPELNNEITLSTLAESKSNLSKKLFDLENCVLIKWGRAQTDEEKKIIMDHYISSKGYSYRVGNNT